MTTPREKLKKYVASIPGPSAPLGTPCPSGLTLSNYDARWLMEHIELLEAATQGGTLPPKLVENARRLTLALVKAPPEVDIDDPPDDGNGAA